MEIERQPAEFTRSAVPGGVSDVARITAKAIKGIVGEATVEKRSGDIFIIKKNYVEWKLYPPGNFPDQYPKHWRLTVTALKNEHNNADEHQQKMFEDDLEYIVKLLIRYH